MASDLVDRAVKEWQSAWEAFEWADPSDDALVEAAVLRLKAAELVLDSVLREEKEAGQ